MRASERRRHRHRRRRRRAHIKTLLRKCQKMPANMPNESGDNSHSHTHTDILVEIETFFFCTRKKDKAFPLNQITEDGNEVNSYKVHSQGQQWNEKLTCVERATKKWNNRYRNCHRIRPIETDLPTTFVKLLPPALTHYLSLTSVSLKRVFATTIKLISIFYILVCTYAYNIGFSQQLYARKQVSKVGNGKSLVDRDRARETVKFADSKGHSRIWNMLFVFYRCF